MVGGLEVGKAMTERQEQTLLFMWARNFEEQVPELKLLFHPPNGGFRHKATAARLKAMGTKPGVPDVFLPVPRNNYHGLWIEMKHGSNKPTKKQWEWIEALHNHGYFVKVCYSAREAEYWILLYLGREDLLDD